MIKLAEYRLAKYGTVSSSLLIPTIFATDNKLSPGSIVAVYRTEIEGEDALVIIPSKDRNKVKEILLKDKIRNGY